MGTAGRKTILDAPIRMASALFRSRREPERDEAKFRDLFQHMAEGASLHELVLDEEGKPFDYVILDANKSFEALLGLSRDAVIGKRSREAYGVPEAPYLDIYAKVALTGEATSFETYFPAMGKHFSISVYRPSPGRFATIFEDISERKKTEAALKEKEDRLKFALGAAKAGTWSWDLRTGANTWSEELWRLYGLEPDSVAPSYESWMETVAPEDRARVAEELGRTVSAEAELNLEWKVEGAGGRRWLMSRGRPEFDQSGKAASYHGVVIDISDRKNEEAGRRRNEERLQRLVDILQHPSDSIQGFLDYALAQALQLTESKLGYIYFYDEERREFILNTWSREVMGECRVADPQTRHELDKTGIWGEAVRQRRPIVVNDFEDPNPLKKGYPEGHVGLRRFLTLPVLKDGRIVATIGLANKADRYDQGDVLQASLLMDAVWKVTERMRIEKENERLLGEKDLILREVHHRLKNNMNAIAGFLGLQKAAAADETAKRALRDAESRIRSMLVLYSKLYQSAAYASISVLDYLPDLIDDIVRNFRSETAVKVEQRIEDIRLDAKRMQPLGIIVNELVTNIMKYAFAGRREGSIRVSVGARDGRVEAYIRDDGIGMPESVDFSGSSGFGLTLVRGLAEQLGGSVRIERGEATTVVLEFPQ